MTIDTKDPRPSRHPMDLILPFMEARLSPEEEKRVREHLQHCTECSEALYELKSMTSRLAREEHIFCPGTWELHELAETGAPLSDSLRAHLERCALCRQEFETYCRGPEKTALPPALAQEIRREYGTNAPTKVKGALGPFGSGFWDWLRSVFMVPATAVAVGAALLLVVVMIQPHGATSPLIAIGSVSWDGDDVRIVPKSPFAVKEKPLVAVVIVLLGFTDPWPQAKVDALYEALIPTPELERSYDFVSPREIGPSLKGLSARPEDRSQLLARLKDRHDVSATLFLEITRKDKQTEVSGMLLENSSGKTVRSVPAETTEEASLPSRLPGVERELLDVQGEVN
jgi:hypothetical protein